MAYASFHDGVWWLVNLTDRAWHTADGGHIGRNTPVQLVDGLELQVSAGADGGRGRTWRVTMRTA
jgi:hypothetical protein